MVKDMRPNQIQGIVFDLDGTLVDSLSVTFEAFNHGIERAGGKRHGPLELLSYFGPGEGAIFAKIVGQDRAEEAYQACKEYLDANMAKVPLHSGVADLLGRLRKARIPISIFTGRSWDTTEMILKHHGILDHFVSVIAHDHV